MLYHMLAGTVDRPNSLEITVSKPCFLPERLLTPNYSWNSGYELHKKTFINRVLFNECY